MTTRICGAWLGFLWISSILGDFMWISWIPEGSAVPGLMTGSAGTAMDVLVTCFSKMGGGSGRRRCQGGAGSVICRPTSEFFANLFFSRSSFSPNVSKT